MVRLPIAECLLFLLYHVSIHANTPKNITFNFTPTNHSTIKETTKNNATKLGRNDKINVVYQDGKRLDSIKYKKVSADIENGKCKITKY